MPDDPKLKISIETSADLKGAEAATRAIEGVGAAAEQAAKEVEKLNEAQAAPDAPKARLKDLISEDDSISITQAANRERAAAALSEIASREKEEAIDAAGRAAVEASERFAQAETAAKGLGGGLGEIKAAGGPATMIMRGLETAGRGGVSTFIGLAQAIRGVIAAVTRGLGPVGLLITGLGLLGGAYLALRDKLRPAAQATEDFEKNMEAAKKAADDLSKTKADALVQQWTRAAEAADLYRASVEAIRTVEDARTDADEAIELAKVRADDSLTPVQRLEQEQTVRADARRRRAGSATAAEDPRITAGDSELKKAQDQIALATEEVARRETILARTKATPKGLAGRVASAEDRRSEAALALGVADTAASRDRLKPALEAAETELANALAAQAANAETFDARLKARQEELQAAIDALTAAYAAQTAAVAKLGSSSITISAEEKARQERERGTTTAETIVLESEKARAAAEVGLAADKAPAVDKAVDDFFTPLDRRSSTITPPFAPNANILQRGGGALPGDRSASVSQESVDKIGTDLAEPIQDLQVPPVDPAPVANAVKEVNTRLQKEVGSFADSTVASFRTVNVVLAAHRKEIEVLRGMIEAKA